MFISDFIKIIQQEFIDLLINLHYQQVVQKEPKKTHTLININHAGSQFFTFFYFIFTSIYIFFYFVLKCGGGGNLQIPVGYIHLQIF